MRFSHQRDTIRKIIYSTNSHPTADQVFIKAKKIIPNISLGTVYRNLKQLEKAGILQTIYDGNIIRYDWKTEPHNHLKCKICDDLIDVDMADLIIQPDFEKKYKFEVDDIEMTIIGTCNKHINK
ncbi:MAG: transcriptional repressor [Candidatus Marinimicrobia bacterium]|jgi:Fur family ferric uptake transcriptional regulator/Fur family peroxide stress response transcriptional regulator|nr:transcriptional repressor [Candidatus Neomarinimicrobiota bacterium]|tara:strand:+ start:706 stop:1077 length:372 start_codon:yes stop_codon:yes gene_type:complete